MRLIDKDALLEKLGIAENCEVCTQNNEPYCRWKPDVVDVCEIISDAPTIEPERKKGKWIDTVVGGTLPVIVCDQCNTFFPLQFGASHNFCPNCGADMREGGE